jgi:anti-anti-sigma factor
MNAAKENLRRPPVPTPLRLTFEGGEGGEGLPLHAAVHGEIDYASAFSMQVRIAAACRQRNARGLILDLAGVAFLDSSGLGAILHLQREPACQRGGLVLSGLTRHVRRIIELTGLEQRLIVVDTPEEGETLLLFTAAGADVSASPHRDRLQPRAARPWDALQPKAAQPRDALQLKAARLRHELQLKAAQPRTRFN